VQRLPPHLRFSSTWLKPKALEIAFLLPQRGERGATSYPSRVPHLHSAGGDCGAARASARARTIISWITAKNSLESRGYLSRLRCFQFEAMGTVDAYHSIVVTTCGDVTSRLQTIHVFTMRYHSSFRYNPDRLALPQCLKFSFCMSPPYRRRVAPSCPSRRLLRAGARAGLR